MLPAVIVMGRAPQGDAAMKVVSTGRRWAAALLTGASLTVLSAAATTLTPAPALAQSEQDFRVALESYGFWQQHPRWGEVWVPFGKPRSWRPYTVGRWVYTDEWGWYWVSGQDEEAWGWITFHYGRWIFDRRLGWAWVPGDEWAPAWVNWRRSDSIVGWAPAPPEDVIYDYDDNPSYWSFVEPRYLAVPLVPRYFVPPQRVPIFIQQTVVVNRTFISERGAHFAVNPGINPAFIAARAGRPLDTFRVRPRVLAGTQGVAGAVAISAAQNRIPGGPPPGGRAGPGARRGPPPGARPNLPPVTVQRAATIAPAQTVQPPQALGHERGRLGSMPPRAAQGGAPGGAPSSPPRGGSPSGGPGAPPPAAHPSSPPAPPAGGPPGDRSRPFGPGARPQESSPPSAFTAPPAASPPHAPPPAARPASPPPAAAPAPQRPQGGPPPQRPAPPPQMQRPPGPPPQMQRPSAPPPQMQRPAAPPPQMQRPAAPPPQMQRPPAPPPQMQRPAAPPPQIQRPPAPPAAAHPAPPRRPGEKPEEKK